MTIRDPLTHYRGEGGTLCGRKGFITNLDRQKRPTSRNWIESRTSSRRYLLAFGVSASCPECNLLFPLIDRIKS